MIGKVYKNFQTLIEKATIRKSGNLLCKNKDYKSLYEDEFIKVVQLPGCRKKCMVSFTGIGHSLGGIDLQSPEFTKSSTQYNKLFIIDKNRSWGNAIDWQKLEKILHGHIQDADTTMLGNSMGGFLAILSAHRFNAKNVIAFAPQWSIDPDIVPTENRWWKYRKSINQIIYRDLSKSFNPKTQYDIFFGGGPEDAKHIQFFPGHLRNVNVNVIPGCDHNVAAYLKERGTLYSTIEACLISDKKGNR